MKWVLCTIRRDGGEGLDEGGGIAFGGGILFGQVSSNVVLRKGCVQEIVIN